MVIAHTHTHTCPHHTVTLLHYSELTYHTTNLNNCLFRCTIFKSNAVSNLKNAIDKVHMYGTCHKKLHKIRQFLQKFCVDSVKLSCRFHKASMQLTVELQYNFRGARLPVLRNDSSLSTDLSLTQLTSSCFSVERLCCVRIWHTSFVLVATYVCT